jgi:hypothetical protein
MGLFDDTLHGFIVCKFGFHRVLLGCYMVNTEIVDSRWKGLYKTGGVVAWVSLALIPVQGVIYAVWPPPDTVTGFFTVLQENWLRGLLNLDLLYILSNVLVIFIYLALYAALRRASPSATAVALALGLVSIAIYFSSNVSFEMLALSGKYAAATTEAQRNIFLSSGETLLAVYQGTAYDVYYILGAVGILIISTVMLRSDIFSKATAYTGLVAGVLMLVPATAGTLGIILAFVSLLPTMVWLVLLARRFSQLARL